MSLLATATYLEPEQNNSSVVAKKKRVSTLGNVENGARPMPPLPHLEETKSSANAETCDFDGVEEYNSQTTNRVSQLLNKMTAINAFHDGEGLADYKPSSVVNTSGLRPANVDAMTTMASRVSDVLPPTAQLPQIVQPRQLPQPDYMPNAVQPHRYSNYHTVHNAKPSFLSPHTTRAERPNMLASDDRLMEKLNYLIHLMEEQQMEKTNNVMEEFILYCLLGVFMIYTVDSFARVGKYSR